MKSTEPPHPSVLAMISRSSAFHTYQHLFINGFSLPLFLEYDSTQPASGAGDTRAAFCLRVHEGSAACAGCPLSPLKSFDGRPPQVWIGRCGAGLHVAAVPVVTGELAKAWLVTGHAAPDDGACRPRLAMARALRRAGLVAKLDRELLADFHRIPRVNHREWLRAVRFLRFIGIFLGSQLNSILIGNSPTDSPEVAQLKRSLRDTLRRGRLRPDDVPRELASRFKRETGMSVAAFDERCRLEQARRELLASSPSHTDMLDTARRAGWDSGVQLHRAFVRYLYETPPEHCRRISRCDLALSTELE